MNTADERSTGVSGSRGLRVGASLGGEELAEIVGAMPLGVVLVEGDIARAIMSNRFATELCGRDLLDSSAEQRREWLRRADGSAWSLEDLPSMRALRGERVEAQELIVISPDGRTRRVEVYAIPVEHCEGRRVLLTLLDVTRRKRAEDHVLAKLTELETALAALPDVYFRLDVEGVILDARSGRTARWPVEPLIGRRIELAFESNVLPRIERAIREVRDTQALATVEYEHDAGGGARWHEVRILPISRGELVLIVRDTTELKSAQDQLMRSLEEKDVLLKEVHHRVKNNLQMISSLLRLQGQRSPSPEVRAMFQDSQSRIKTIAMIHDQLYRAENIACIDFGAHLRDLASMLVELFGRDECTVRTRLDVESIILDLEMAIPLGLIANELITNALKHAFVGRREGTIHVSLAREDRTLTLTVADDGIGYPSDSEIESKGSLGLRVIRLLSEHLHAHVAFDRPRKAVSVSVPLLNRN